MDINLYVTLSECHPMLALESIAAGTPCIISDVSNIYDFDDNLRKLMIVRKHDLLDIINKSSLKEWNKFLNYSLIPLNKSIDNYDNYINVNSTQSIKNTSDKIFINNY